MEGLVTGAALILARDGRVLLLGSVRTSVVDVVQIAAEEMEVGVVMTSKMKN